jgi:hypothetical protein
MHIQFNIVHLIIVLMVFHDVCIDLQIDSIQIITIFLILLTHLIYGPMSLTKLYYYYILYPSIHYKYYFIHIHTINIQIITLFYVLSSSITVIIHYIVQVSSIIYIIYSRNVKY